MRNRLISSALVVAAAEAVEATTVNGTTGALTTALVEAANSTLSTGGTGWLNTTITTATTVILSTTAAATSSLTPEVGIGLGIGGSGACCLLLSIYCCLMSNQNAACASSFSNCCTCGCCDSCCKDSSSKLESGRYYSTPPDTLEMSRAKRYEEGTRLIGAGPSSMYSHYDDRQRDWEKSGKSGLKIQESKLSLKYKNSFYHAWVVDGILPTPY